MGAELLASVCVLEAALEHHAELSDQLLYEMGVTVDDKANTWQCSDGRRG